MLHIPFVTEIATFNITKIHYYQYLNHHHKFLTTTLCNASECTIECSTIIILARCSWICLQISQCVFEKVWNRLALMFNNLQQILFLSFVIIVYARCKILNQLNRSSHRSLWDLVAHWLSRWLSTGGSWVRLPLSPPRWDLGQVLYLQLPVRTAWYSDTVSVL